MGVDPETLRWGIHRLRNHHGLSVREIVRRLGNIGIIATQEEVRKAIDEAERDKEKKGEH